METTVRSASLLVLAAAAMVGAAACSDKPTTPIDPSPLTGLSRGESNDTIGTVPPPPAQATPGSFHGYVLGPGTGPDTMATAPRLEGITVTIYPYSGYVGNQPNVGDAVATMVTDANGWFESPVVDGGEYAVSFVPPASSIYRGMYVTTTIHAGSSGGNWWIILPRK